MKRNASLKIDHLKEFILLSTVLNYTNAAKRLHIDQSSLSKHISELEKTLEVPLFDRSSHAVLLTNYGEEFLSHAKRIVAVHEDALREINRMKRSEDSVLRVGYLRDASRAFLSDACHRFTDMHDSSLQLISLNPGEAIEKIRDGELDIAISLKTRYSQLKGIRTKKIFSDSLELLVPRKHRLYKYDEIDVEDLSGISIIASSPSQMQEISYFLKRQLSNAIDGIDLKETIYDGDSVAMLSALENDAMFVFHHQEGLYGTDCKNISILGVDLACDFCVFWKDYPERRILDDFAECVVDAYNANA